MVKVRVKVRVRFRVRVKFGVRDMVRVLDTSTTQVSAEGYMASLLAECLQKTVILCLV